MKTKDCFLLVFSGALLRRETFISVINVENSGKKKTFRDNSKPAITCYIHWQPYMNHVNKNLNNNF